MLTDEEKRERHKEYCRRYRKANPDKLRAYREGHKKEHAEYAKKWQETHKERCNRRVVQWRKDHREKNARMAFALGRQKQADAWRRLYAQVAFQGF